MSIETTTTPLLTIENPALLGMPTEEGEARANKYKGERTMDVSLRPCYVHGALQDACGYDIANFAAGHIRDVDTQPAVIIDADDKRHDCVIVAVTLPHVPGTRAALIVTPDEVEKTKEYLTRKAADTTPQSPRIML